MDGMLAQSCNSMEVGVMNSTIEHERAGMGCLASVQFGSRTVIGIIVVG